MEEHLGNKYFKIFIFIYLLNLFKSGDPHQLRNDEKVHFNGYKVFRIVPMNDAQLHTLKYLAYTDHGSNFDFWKFPTFVNETADVMVSPEKMLDLERLLTANRIPKTVVISDVERYIQKERLEYSSPNAFSGDDSQTFFTQYRRLDEVHDHLDRLAANYKKITTIISIGKSDYGSDLKVIKIGDRLPNSPKPSIWIDGGIHAREWISIPTVTYIATKLVEDYEKDEEIKELVNTYNWYILPVVNPDGYEYSRTTDRMWRKNRRRAVSSLRNCVGVDLNRNWGYHWAEEGMSFNPCHEIYGGPSAFSEPESKAISEFILERKDNMKAFLSMHAYGQYWFTPWGYTTGLPTNFPSMVAVAREAVRALFKVHATPYTVGSSAKILYVAAGGSDDWALGVAKINYSYTVELRAGHSYGFFLPSRYILPTGEETLAGVKALAKAIKTEL